MAAGIAPVMYLPVRAMMEFRRCKERRGLEAPVNDGRV